MQIGFPSLAQPGLGGPTLPKLTKLTGLPRSSYFKDEGPGEIT